MLKVDLHIHSKEDPVDNLNYSAKRLVDKAIKLKFNAIAFTFHGAYFYPKKLVSYAKSKGLLLIPGSEMAIEGKDVLIYNINKKEFDLLNSCKNNFDDFAKKSMQLKKKNRDLFIMAPHPYFVLNYCVKDLLEKYGNKLFDAVEFSWFYCKLINLNKKAVEVAKKLDLPLFANSDTHLLDTFGRNYSLVDSKKCDSKSIFKSIKSGKVELVSKPVSLLALFFIGLRIFTLPLFKKSR